MTTLDEISHKLDEVIAQLKILNWDEAYWEMVPGLFNDSPIQLQPHQDMDIVRIKNEEGFITGFVVTANDPSLEVEVDVDGEITTATITSLNQIGLTSFNPRMPWVTKYDETNKVFEVCYTPVPYKFYHNYITVKAKNPSDNVITFSYKFWSRQRKRR